ncbi:tRNA wybutosine-synthesizing protein 5 [Asparagus officinalis]|uniref:tRNA wybutosine-synthesizing protein 5 n=1 Tax=Asparagus officinalis TaxID=4686 RepID=A0A5P1ELU7_ASPOF|nr:tRNA wybutosine-synthesizing protein 5 [Asparagus officinalis]
MAKLDDSLRVLHFDDIPSFEEFSSTIEPRNVPAVFRGAIRNWEAISRWDPARGGLDYLEESIGSVTVDAMLSSSAPVFYGDVQSHERVSLPFGTFISSCKHYVQKNADMRSSSTIEQEEFSASQVHSEESCSTSLDSSDQIYLAQVPIFSNESKDKSPLGILSNDLQTPVFVRAKELTSINLWMNKARSRSSTHYDPYHNLLCIVAGSKQVVLWPPSACPFLYPMPIHGESSNHSAVDLENPDLLVHPRSEHSLEYSQKIILHSGDALFIPEGWFHQVDSDNVTIAVNFWWKSYIMSNILEHMDAYYLRRILNRLAGKEMNSMLQNSSVMNLEGREKAENANDAAKGCSEFNSNIRMENVNENDTKQGLDLQQLEPFALRMLYELISLVHNVLKVGGRNEAMEHAYLKGSSVSSQNVYGQTATFNSSLLVADPVASIFCAVEPHVLKKVLLEEVLTRKFDEMDQQMTKEQQHEFYQIFYSVFDDPNTAMGAILKGKETFAFQVVKNVLDQYLGLRVEKPE